jgi:polysaccharide pyruvyl transferase WcaK-like protein
VPLASIQPSRSPSFLIVHSHPVNGGDEALLRATMMSIAERWPQSSIQVLCGAADLGARGIPDLQLEADLYDLPTIPYRSLYRTSRRVWAAVAHVPGLARATYSLTRRIGSWGRKEVEARYREADIVLSAPGGFLHDHYEIAGRLDSLEFALNLGKKVMIFAQSIGPFWKSKSIRRVREVFNRIPVICVRDEISRDHLLACGVAENRIRVTADAAFLLHERAGTCFRPRSGAVRRIGLCFRFWPHSTATTEETISKGSALAARLLGQRETTLHFISTCQGVPGYIDDSELAVRVVNALPARLRDRCEVDRQRYCTPELQRKLAELDAFIGMRLHGCLLAMLGGTPTVGLAYEAKTPEIFGQMGLRAWQLPFEAEEELWIERADALLEQAPEIHAQLQPTLDHMRTRAQANLAALQELMEDSADPMTASNSSDRAHASV